MHPLKVLFYVQHLLGIGHLARASRIAARLVQDGFEVTMVTGGLPVDGFPGPGIHHVALPAIASGPAGFSELVDSHGAPLDEAFRARRRAQLLATYQTLAPDIVLIEAFPFGRRQVRFELLALLEAIEASPKRPVVASSVRDILQQNRKPGRDEESLALVEAHFDAVLVHGDPKFIRLEDSFPLAQRLEGKLYYTGLVAPAPPAPPQQRWDVVVSAGGGAVGGDLIRAAAQAQALLPPTLRWCLIAGPNLPAPEYDALAQGLPATTALFRFRKDFPSLLAGAQVSVSQAGYNTVCDVLVAGCRAVLVPFAAGGETEQGLRATHLAAAGRAEVVTEQALSPDTLAQALRNSLRLGAKANAPALPVALDLEGAAHTARILRDLASRR